MRPIVFLDTETTSLGPKREAWEVAMIRRDDQGEKEINFFIADLRLDQADLMSLKIGGFYDRYPFSEVSEALPEELVYSWNAAKLIEQWTRGAFIVGAVPNFDTEVLARLLRKNDYLPAWHYHLRDVEAMAVGYLAGQGPVGGPDAERVAGDWKSDDLSQACGVEPPGDEERHTALGDARWAMRWYDAIVGGE